MSHSDNHLSSSASSIGNLKMSTNSTPLGSRLSINKNTISNDNGSIKHKRAITLFPCQAEHKSELSFDENVILTNIKQSKETGWYEATAPDGKSGLVPANYIKFIDDLP